MTASNMNKIIQVEKRDGKSEKFDITKIDKVIEWAINGYSGVSMTDIEINAKINIHEGISTREIHQLIIESAANLISVEHPNYQYVAGRLLNYQLRKDVWGGKHPPRLKDFLHVGVKRKFMILPFWKNTMKKKSTSWEKKLIMTEIIFSHMPV